MIFVNVILPVFLMIGVGYIFEKNRVKFVFSFMANNYKGSFRKVDSLYVRLWQQIVQK